MWKEGISIMPRVVIINGYPGAGKDTFVELCSKFSKVDNVLTSTPAKNALTLLGWDGVKTDEARDLLAYLIQRSYYLWDGPTKYVLEKIHDSTADILFVHVREPENIHRFIQEIPNRAITVIVDRGQNDTIFTNDSDRDVENWDYDLRVSNNGTLEDLEKVAEAFCKLIKEDLI